MYLPHRVTYLFVLFYSSLLTVEQMMPTEEELYVKLRKADDRIIQHLYKEHNRLFYGPKQLHYRLRELVNEYNELLLDVVRMMRGGDPKAFRIRQALIDDGGPRYKYEIRNESLIAKSNWTSKQKERLSDLCIYTNEVWHKLKKKVGAPTSPRPTTNYDTVYRIVSHSDSEDYYYYDNETDDSNYTSHATK